MSSLYSMIFWLSCGSCLTGEYLRTIVSQQSCTTSGTNARFQQDTHFKRCLLANQEVQTTFQNRRTQETFQRSTWPSTVKTTWIHIVTYEFCVGEESFATIVLWNLHIRSASLRNRAAAFYITLAASQIFTQRYSQWLQTLAKNAFHNSDSIRYPRGVNIALKCLRYLHGLEMFEVLAWL